MPNRAPTACRPGCPNPRGSCPVHPLTSWSAGAHGRAMPPGWPTTRARILHRDGHRCRQCAAPATEVHHTVPGAEDDALLWSMCAPCHLAITSAQAAAARALTR